MPNKSSQNLKTLAELKKARWSSGLFSDRKNCPLFVQIFYFVSFAPNKIKSLKMVEFDPPLLPLKTVEARPDVNIF